MDYKYILDSCLKCGTPTYDHPETHNCIECGEVVINFCSSEDCAMDEEIPHIPVNAKYCPFCGAESILHDLIVKK